MKHRQVCILLAGGLWASVASLHAAEKLTIPQIQGPTHSSPHVRSSVIFEGVVTHIFGNSFIVRDEVVTVMTRRRTASSSDAKGQASP